MLSLNDVRVGQTVCIFNIPDENIAMQALRIGVSPGENVKCIAKIPAGPIVVQRGGMELAIGRSLCEKIQVVLP